MEITLKSLFTVLKKALLMMIILALVCGAVAFVYSSFFARKVYTSSASYFLFSPTPDLTEGEPASKENMTNYNNVMVVGSRILPNIMEVMLNEEMMTHLLRYVNEMAEVDPDYRLDGHYTGAQLAGMMSYKVSDAAEYSLVFRITCKAHSAHDARILLDALGAQQNEVLREMDIGDAFSFRRVSAPGNGRLTSPNTVTNTAICAFAGAVITYLAYLIAHLMYSRVYTEEDLKEQFDFPVLAQIPRMEGGDGR